MDKNSNIVVFGSSGLVGSSILRRLKTDGYKNVYAPNRNSVNLAIKHQVIEYLHDCGAEYVFLCAAKVGGIMANMKYPAEFGYENGIINLNVIDSCHITNVKKLLFLGSSCIYPRECPQPMKEEYLLSGPFEPTNELYALAKTFGLKLCEAYNKQYNDNFISCQPCNIYGVGDHFDTENSHVVSALISKFHKAKIENSPTVTAWGTGSAKRELLYVDDCADACLFLMNSYDKKEFINVGTGDDLTIRELTYLIAKVVGYTGEIIWDTSKPDGMPRKVMDVSKINNLGWKYKTSLEEGLIKTYNWYLSRK